jgi:hypothetical protein
MPSSPCPPYLKNEGALEDYLLDSVCRETVLRERWQAHVE